MSRYFLVQYVHDDHLQLLKSKLQDPTNALLARPFFDRFVTESLQRTSMLSVRPA